MPAGSKPTGTPCWFDGPRETSLRRRSSVTYVRKTSENGKSRGSIWRRNRSAVSRTWIEQSNARSPAWADEPPIRQGAHINSLKRKRASQEGKAGWQPTSNAVGGDARSDPQDRPVLHPLRGDYPPRTRMPGRTDQSTGLLDCFTISRRCLG